MRHGTKFMPGKNFLGASVLISQQNKCKGVYPRAVKAEVYIITLQVIHNAEEALQFAG